MSSVPNWPKEDSYKSSNYLDSAIFNQRIKFAEWILAVLIPWPAPTYSWIDYGNNPLEIFSKILMQLHSSTFLLNELNNCYYGPPGYDNVKLSPDDSDNYNCFKYSQKCIARFIGILARGLK